MQLGYDMGSYGAGKFGAVRRKRPRLPEKACTRQMAFTVRKATSALGAVADDDGCKKAQEEATEPFPST